MRGVRFCVSIGISSTLLLVVLLVVLLVLVVVWSHVLLRGSKLCYCCILVAHHVAVEVLEAQLGSSTRRPDGGQC